MIGHCLQSTKQQQQQIYNHFLQSAKTEEPSIVIERFRSLFIRGTGYQENKIRDSLEAIVNAKDAEAEFHFFLNRCCHIIINRWQMYPSLKVEIPELVIQLERALPPGGAYSRTSRKLRQLVKNFQKTEHYLKLQRLARLIDGSLDSNSRRIESVNNSVGDLIQRYPYLHQHCLLSEDSSEEFQETVYKIQSKIQEDYELSLSQYITNRVRLIQTVRKYKAANRTKIPKKLIQPVQNPTLLSDRELDKALRHYMGKVENNYTYRDLSRSFLTYTSQIKSYKAFKNDLYEYLISGLDPNYAQRRFNHKLYQYLDITLSDFDRREVNEFLIMRTYCQLFKLLVIDSKSNFNHNLYMDLITYLGETKTIGLLLKLVLLCSKVKPYLEKRFSLLFSYYESITEDKASWLIKSLENLQIAFSVHFGKADFSLIQII